MGRVRDLLHSPTLEEPAPKIGKFLETLSSYQKAPEFSSLLLPFTLILSIGLILSYLILTDSAARTSPALTTSHSKHLALVPELVWAEICIMWKQKFWSLICSGVSGKFKHK